MEISNTIKKQLLRVCEDFLGTAEIDEGHSIEHIKAVLDHVEKALDYINLSETQKLALRCAAILHDVDDHKFFDTSETCSNARNLLNQIKPLLETFLKNRDNVSKGRIEDSYDPRNFDEFVLLVNQSINLVSCSTNGNRKDDRLPAWILYPRIADRLEAIGRIGILRAIQYGKYKQRVMYDDQTERVYTLEELRKVASPERFQKYLKGEHSLTTIGHVYDKILHIGISSDFGVRNEYFDEIASIRKEEVEDWILDFWHSEEPRS